jgi:hypothetical protein
MAERIKKQENLPYPTLGFLDFGFEISGYNPTFHKQDQGARL